MPPCSIAFPGSDFTTQGSRKLFVVAPASSLRNGSAFALLSSNSALLAAATALAAKVGPGSPTGSSASTLVLGGGDDTPDEVVLVPLAENVSRYYSGTHSMAITAGLASAGISTSGGSVLIVLAQEAHLVPAAMAVARACPTYSRKTSGGNATSPPPVVVGFASATDPGVLLDESKALSAAELITDSIRQAADIAETPAEDASTADVEARARAVLEGVPGVDITTIAGDDLRAAGLEGIYNVGRAAVVPPRLVILRYTPAEAAQAATPAIGLVGKGIVYDTGGLNLKRSGGRHMKGDMAGAASVLGAFSFWAKFSSEHPESAFPAPLVAALCLAENSIGPTAYRPDDILTMHSGLTCEVHNTDAEGRFVVGDGCSYLARELGVRTIIDSATLTGHSSFTGAAHCAIMSNCGEMEATGLQAGLECGETGFPMIFLPEAHKAMVSSPVADMVNTAGGAGGMGSAIGGYFIFAQVADIPDIKWLHIDLAGPSRSFGLRNRATGFGVGLQATIAYKMASAAATMAPKL